MVRISVMMIWSQRTTFHVLIHGMQRIALQTHNIYKRVGVIVLIDMNRQKLISSSAEILVLHSFMLVKCE